MVEGVGLENRYTEQSVSRVRIPLSPYLSQIVDESLPIPREGRVGKKTGESVNDLGSSSPEAARFFSLFVVDESPQMNRGDFGGDSKGGNSLS